MTSAVERRASLLSFMDPNETQSVTLSSSLKAHQAFLKRIRLPPAEETHQANVSDTVSLTLEKYVDELPACLLDSMGKIKRESQVWLWCEILVRLHARFQTAITKPLNFLVAGQLSAGATDILRQKSLIRVWAEMSLINLVSYKDVVSALQAFMQQDMSSGKYEHLPLVLSFYKSSTSYLPDSGDVPPSDLVPLSESLKDYFQNLSKLSMKQASLVQKQDRLNHAAYIRSGVIFDERETAYAALVTEQARLFNGACKIAEIVQQPAPVMPEQDDIASCGMISISDRGRGDNADELNSVGPFEDEETKRFYTDILDLRDLVPGALLGLNEMNQQVEPVETNPAESQDETKSTGSQITVLIANLPDNTNRALIDQAAVDFALLNSKASRNRLIKCLAAIPKGRTDLIPYYSRLIATLNPYLPDIAGALIQILEEEFHYLLKKKNVKELAETRRRNTTYFSELTKFSICPSHISLHCLSRCVDDFSGFNLDMLANLLEGCGRFMLYHPDLSEKTSSLIEAMRRKQASLHLDSTQVVMLDNAFYQCNPTQITPRAYVIRTPEEIFIRHIIYNVLSDQSVEKVVKLLRKCHWSEPIVYSTIYKAFTRPFKIKFGYFTCFASALADLQRYKPRFVMKVIDQTLDDIKTGLEQNVFKYHQRRISSIRYLGELYLFRIINSNLIFDTLWLLVTFGHRDGRPLPGDRCAIDPADDFTRVRLVCTLLDLCGTCFDRGIQRALLDSFLIFFQLYIFCKVPVPMDIAFILSDTFDALRPEMWRAENFEEAVNAVDKMLKSGSTRSPAASSSRMDTAENLDDISIATRRQANKQLDADSIERGTIVDREELSDLQENSSTEDDDFTREGEGISSEDDTDLVEAQRLKDTELSEEQNEEDEFEKELSRMMSESTVDGNRQISRKTNGHFDVTLPIGKRTAIEATSADEAHMRFTLLTKKGSRQQNRTVDVPVDAALAVNSRSNQALERFEQQQLKKIVLDYERREAILTDLKERQQMLERGQGFRSQRTSRPFMDR